MYGYGNGNGYSHTLISFGLCAVGYALHRGNGRVYVMFQHGRAVQYDDGFEEGPG